MNAITWRFKPGFLAIAAVAAVVLAMPWSLAEAQPGSGVDCGAQVDRAADALTSGGKIDAAQATKLESCIRNQPSQTANSLELAQADSTTTQNAAAPVTVLASFSTILGDESGPLCLKFNSDGMISGHVVVASMQGGYLGTPGAFTLLSLTFVGPGGYSIGFVGLTIGPLLLAVPISGLPVIPFFYGFQVPNCAT